MDNRHLKAWLKVFGRGVFFYAVACGSIYNDWSVRQVYADEPVSATSSTGVRPPSAVPSVGAPHVVAPQASTGTARPPQARVVQEDPAPRAIEPVDFRTNAGRGCKALSQLKEQRCKDWSIFPSEPFASCREESLNQLRDARAALELAQLYENRGKKTEAQIKSELIDKLSNKTSKGGIEMSQGDAETLAQRLISEYGSSQAAYAKCRDGSLASAWGHNMVLAGVISKRDYQEGTGDTQKCTAYIKSSIGTPSYDDGLASHLSNDQGEMRTYQNQRKAKSYAGDWKLTVNFEKIPSDLPAGYRSNGWDNLGYKLYSLDLYARCSKGHDLTQSYGEGATTLKGSIKRNWKAWIAGTVILGVVACLIWCKDDDKYYRPPTSSTTTTSGNTTATTTSGNTTTTSGNTTATTTSGNTTTTSGNTTATTTSGNTTANTTSGNTTSNTTSGNTTTGTTGGQIDEDFNSDSGGSIGTPRGVSGRTLAPGSGAAQRSLAPRSGNGPRKRQ